MTCARKRKAADYRTRQTRFRGQVRGEVRQQALRQPVDATGQRAVHEADMAAVRMELQRHGGGNCSGCGNAAPAGRDRWRVQQQRGRLDRRQQRPALLRA
jgi:hypothetical protein